MGSATLDPARVPAGLVALLPLAEQWGIGDDFLREGAVEAATYAQLGELAEVYGRFNADLLFGWLAGPEAERQPPLPEYVALTNLTMAVDLARLRLARRGERA